MFTLYIYIYRKLRDHDATKFHIQLSIAAIFFMLLVFMVGGGGGGGQDRNSGWMHSCLYLLDHYFNLASILWMLAESLLLVQKLAFVFIQIIKKVIIITSLVCWCKLSTTVFLPYPLPPPSFPFVILVNKKNCVY